MKLVDHGKTMPERIMFDTHSLNNVQKSKNETESTANELLNSFLENVSVAINKELK